MKPFLLACLLAVPASAFAQAPIPTFLSTEHPIAAPGAPASPVPGASAIASNGSNFLVITSNDRLFQGYLHALMLVDGNAQPLLDASTTVSDCGDRDGVASDGRGYLAVFGCRGSTTGVLMASDGTARTFNIHAQTRTQMTSHDTAGTRAVAWDGTQYVVLTTVERLEPLAVTSTEIVTRVSPTGEVLQNDLETGASPNSVIAARNGISVIASPSGAGVAVRTMNASGVFGNWVPLSAMPVIAAAIAAEGDGFLVVWSDSNGVQAQHLDPSGRPDAQPFVVTGAAGAVAVTAEGSSYRVVWDEVGVIRSAHAGTTRVIDAVKTATLGTRPAVASNGAATVLVWSASDASTSTRARNLDAAGDGQLVHRLVNAQRLGSVGFTSAGPAVAWSEATSHLTDVFDGTSFPPVADGTYLLLPGLDRPLIVSGTAPPFAFRYAEGPEVLFTLPTATPFWTGNGFLAVWTDAAPDNDPFAALPLYAQRFDANGQPLDAAPRQIGTSLDLHRSYSSAAALANGVFAGVSADQVLVVYIDPSGSMQGVLFRGGQVTPIGQIEPAQALANPIAVTSDGRDFLVTWIAGKNGTNSFIASRRVLADGSMPEEMHIDSPGNDTKDAMATFWTGQNYLVVWSTVRDGSSRDLYAIRLGADGRLLDYPPQKIGSIAGARVQFAYRNGLLTVAYERDGRVYWSVAAPPRVRATRAPI